jgi:hypothetical protein
MSNDVVRSGLGELKKRHRPDASVLGSRHDRKRLRRSASTERVIRSTLNGTITVEDDDDLMAVHVMLK